MKRFFPRFVLLVLFLISTIPFVYAQDATLVAWAQMKKGTFSNGQKSPFFSRFWVPAGSQAIQGFSSAAITPINDEFIFVVDNSAGLKEDAACCLLRLYRVKVNFRTNDSAQDSVNIISHLNLTDPHHKVPFSIQADFNHYYNHADNNTVDTLTREQRRLTGADADPESLVVDSDGTFWIGDEYGPFILHFDKTGALLESPYSHPDIISVDSPLLNNKAFNVKTSAGFEGIARSPDGRWLYPLLEKPLTTDQQRALRMLVFDTQSKQFIPEHYFYPLDEGATEVREFITVNADAFLTLEQNTTNNEHAYKRVYLVSKQNVASGERLQKTLVADLMHIHDPNDLNHDGKPQFSYPKLTIEAVTILDANTLLLVNDNNFQEPTEFIKINLSQALPIESLSKNSLDTANWEEESIFNALYINNTHSSFGWLTVALYFVLILIACRNIYIARKHGRSYWYWLFAAFVLTILGFYRQMNVIFFITQMLRDIFVEMGWYEERRQIQAVVIKLLAVASVVFLVFVSFVKNNGFKRHGLSLIGIVMLGAFKVVELVSFHNVDHWLMYSLKVLKAYHGVEILLLLIVSLGFFLERKSLR